ncbi:MAG: type II toxin-antitoxin system VapC family toxin [Euryarchaeota archaeon]|nr:type II toxin-antitoxin system VapC family toxin [Euryarchaeota archaeon]
MRLAGSLVFDAGALIELVFSTPAGSRLMEQMIEGEIEVHATEVAVVELGYILCRRVGREEAKKRIDKLLASGYVAVEDTSPLMDAASAYKCERAISLPDCFSLALAGRLSVPVLFATREKELVKEMERRPFDVEILFLRDAVRS